MDILAESIIDVLSSAADGLTVHQITRRTGHPDGREVRLVLNGLEALGRVVYCDGRGNNRRYRMTV